MKPIRADLRLRNNPLLEAREVLGWSQAEAARRIPIDPSQLSAYETMREPPMSPRGWRPTALRIAAAYGMSPELLWPDVTHEPATRTASLRLDAADVARLVGREPALQVEGPDAAYDRGELRRILIDGVNEVARGDTQVAALMRRFGLDGDEPATLAIAGEEAGVTAERMRQIEARALRKLRHPKLAARLRDYL